MRLIFYGLLRDLYGESVEIHARSVADAIEGFSRQQENWPREMRFSAVGFNTEEKLKLSADEVHLMPAAAGGGGKFGSIILGAAMIAAAFIPGIGQIAVGLKAALIISGSMMVAQGVVGLFLKAPTLSKAADPEASKYLGVNQNTTAVGTKIIMAWGRVMIAPHWLSLQSDSTNLSFGVFPATPS